MRNIILFIFLPFTLSVSAQQSDVVAIYQEILNFEKPAGKVIVRDYNALKDGFLINIELYQLIISQRSYAASIGHDYETNFVKKWIDEPVISDAVIVLNTMLSDTNVVEIPPSDFAVKFTDDEIKNLYLKYKHKVWKKLQSKLKVSTICTFSKVAFIGDYAAVYSDSQCDYLCGSGDLFILKKSGGRWQIHAVLNLWVS